MIGLTKIRCIVIVYVLLLLHLHYFRQHLFTVPVPLEGYLEEG